MNGISEAVSAVSRPRQELTGRRRAEWLLPFFCIDDFGCPKPLEDIFASQGGERWSREGLIREGSKPS